MRDLWRLALWGGSAAAALTLVVLASVSETGSRRIATAFAAPDPAMEPARIAARAAEAEAEARRLGEIVRWLAADRERLLAKLDTVERNLEDVTGSVRRQEAAAAHAAAVTDQAAAPEAPPAAPAGTLLPAVIGNAEPPKSDMGIDVGGATSTDGLRALWNSTRQNHAAVVEGLHPLVATRDNGRNKGKELRLILGPIETIEKAAQLCVSLSAARRYCQPVAFEGQKLAEGPERKPAPKAATSPPRSSSPWPFR
jgi:hypothetical protein